MNVAERIAPIGPTTNEEVGVADISSEVVQKHVAVNDLLAELLLLPREDRARATEESR